MKLIAQVSSSDGPLATATVEVVTVSEETGEVISIGRGAVSLGRLSATAETGIVWGLRIDDRPVITFPVATSKDFVDLGEIVMTSQPLAWPAFHAEDGRVYGIPRGGQTPRETAEVPPAPAAVPPAGTTPAQQKMRMSFGELLGNSARQLGSAAEVQGANFALHEARITLKGVPSATEEAISLEFPTSEAAISGVGLSELSFSIRPRGAQTSTPVDAAVVKVPDLVGYTQDLAIRKAGAAGFATDVVRQIVTDASAAGRVLRQIPAAGSNTPTLARLLIRLYIGKLGES